MLNYILDKEFLLRTNDRAWSTYPNPCNGLCCCKFKVLHDEAGNQSSSAPQTSCITQRNNMMYNNSNGSRISQPSIKPKLHHF